jgi:ABC-type glutathione transport system ATPase component
MPLAQSSSATDLENLQQRVFCFRDCRFSVPTKDGEKKILLGVSGEARSGEVLAILGPSGAGKTQLMNMLTLKPGPGTVSGELTLNGAPFTQKCVRQPFTPCRPTRTYRRVFTLFTLWGGVRWHAGNPTPHRSPRLVSS